MSDLDSIVNSLGRAELHAGLRVAIIAGTLEQGGAEKQLVYIVKGLKSVGADVRVYSLTDGGFYYARLESMGVSPVPIGKSHNRLRRIAALALDMRKFRPHIVQAMHFYVNLYAWITAPVSGAMAVGSIRGDAIHDVDANGLWGRWLLKLPRAVLANSYSARENARFMGVSPEKIHILENVIDLQEFDRKMKESRIILGGADNVIAMTICSLISQKRVDKFLRAVALARTRVNSLLGVIVGDGPQRRGLESLAQELGLVPGGVIFLGRQDNIATLLSNAHMLVVSSAHEGFPNVILEAMAASLPVIATPVGDAPTIVRDGITGYIVPMDDVARMADRITELALNPDERGRLGWEARLRVEQDYNHAELGQRILAVYREIANMSKSKSLQEVLR